MRPVPINRSAHHKTWNTCFLLLQRRDDDRKICKVKGGSLAEKTSLDRPACGINHSTIGVGKLDAGGSERSVGEVNDIKKSMETEFCGKEIRQQPEGKWMTEWLVKIHYWWEAVREKKKKTNFKWRWPSWYLSDDPDELHCRWVSILLMRDVKRGVCNLWPILTINHLEWCSC